MPDLLMVSHLARVLDLPTAYFFAESDEEAQVLTGFHWLNPGSRKQVLALLKTLLAKSEK